MSKTPVLKPREVCRILESHGFTLVRQRGSHMQYRHSDGRSTTVPNHPGRDISPVLLRQIAKDISLTIDEFLRLR
jgi:predicted RNA binding protein YcfA (HicA-like mRNA interferase family)